MDVLNTYGKIGKPVTNPDGTPQVIVLTATQSAAINQMYFDDACGLASSLGVVAGSNSVALTVSGTGVTADNLKEYLKTYALIVSGFNFETTVPSELSNNLKLIRSLVDGNNCSSQIFNSKDISNMQQNPDLLNITQPFVWTSTTALRIATGSSSAAVNTFTFFIADRVPYGQLDAYLASAGLVSNLK